MIEHLPKDASPPADRDLLIKVARNLANLYDAQTNQSERKWMERSDKERRIWRLIARRALNLTSKA